MKSRINKPMWMNQFKQPLALSPITGHIYLKQFSKITNGITTFTIPIMLCSTSMIKVIEYAQLHNHKMTQSLVRWDSVQFAPDFM